MHFIYRINPRNAILRYEQLIIINDQFLIKKKC